jgi:hypothetical protein
MRGMSDLKRWKRVLHVLLTTAWSRCSCHACVRFSTSLAPRRPDTTAPLHGREIFLLRVVARQCQPADRSSLPRAQRLAARRKQIEVIRLGDDTISAHDLLEIDAYARRVTANLRKNLLGCNADAPLRIGQDDREPPWNMSECRPRLLGNRGERGSRGKGRSIDGEAGRSSSSWIVAAGIVGRSRRRRFHRCRPNASPTGFCAEASDAARMTSSARTLRPPILTPCTSPSCTSKDVTAALRST